MTRYTKLERKRHVDTSESFAVTPLMPSKKVQSESSSSAPAPAPAPTTQPDTAKEQKPSGKRKAEDSTPSVENTESGKAATEGGAGPSKKAKSKKNKGKGKGKGKDTDKPEDVKAAKERAEKFAEKRRLRKKQVKTKAIICFVCRKNGHSAKDCEGSKDMGVGMCYSCGSLEHKTQDCKKLSKDGNKFKFATCFVCKEQGHLAGACPKNEKGMYPKGGSCRFCNKVDHLAKDCKLTKEEVGTFTLGKIDLVQGADDDDYHIFVDEKRRLTEEQKAVKKMVKATVKAPKKVVSF
ncbi:hypothetical protein BG011_006000 [Mortierella polycephala]|uniref:CCHC-type domain-containing protein n=1 Tax=Mortierella polycephala TaxID=41804 RepID=A0A9P6PW01_9FUNG|nr:hypothetical protein BG011_006000 [Mortierella polycephala]